LKNIINIVKSRLRVLNNFIKEVNTDAIVLDLEVLNDTGQGSRTGRGYVRGDDGTGGGDIRPRSGRGYVRGDDGTGGGDIRPRRDRGQQRRQQRAQDNMRMNRNRY